MTKYEIVPATYQHAFELSTAMREEDRSEVLSLGGMTPWEALESSLDASVEAWAGLADGRVLCIFGVAPLSILGNGLIPWMLSSTELPKHARQFARVSKGVVAIWKEKYPRLENLVDARYSTAVRWLKWLGFNVHPAEAIGDTRAHRVEIGG